MRRLVSFIMTIFLFSYSTLSADMGQFLSSITIELDSPSAVSAQKRGFVSFGGASLRSDYAVFQPFQVVPPSIRAGCSGIDLTFGGMSYLNKNNLQRFLQMLLQGIPSYLFQLALQTVCPQCAELLNNLTALANQINAMGLNSCQAGMMVANFVFDQIGSDINTGRVGYYLDAVKSGLVSFNEMLSRWQRDVSSYLNAAQVNAIIRNGSLLNYVSATTPVGNEVIGFVRATIGDIKFERSRDDKQCIKTKYIAPTVSFYEATYKMTDICSSPQVSYETRTGTTMAVSVCYYVKQKVDQIISKMKNKTPLSQQELEFLALYPFPVFKILKIYAPYPSALEGIKAPLVKYASALTLQTVISRYLSQTLDGVNSLISLAEQGRLPVDCETSTEEVREKFKTFRDMILLAMNEGPRDLQERRQELLKALSVANTVIELERSMYSKFSDNPIVSSYIYAKSLGMK